MKKIVAENLNELYESIVSEHVQEFEEKLRSVFPDLQDLKYHSDENYISLDLDYYTDSGMNELLDTVVNLIKTDFYDAGWFVVDEDSLEDNIFKGNWPDESPFYDEEKILIKLPDYLVENLNEYNKHLQGGKGDDLTRDDVDPDQLEIGIATEMEHTNDPEVAEEIALDHLAEDPEYYSTLVDAGLVDEPEAIKLYQTLISGEGDEPF